VVEITVTDYWAFWILILGSDRAKLFDILLECINVPRIGCTSRRGDVGKPSWEPSASCDQAPGQLSLFAIIWEYVLVSA